MTSLLPTSTPHSPNLFREWAHGFLDDFADWLESPEASISTAAVSGLPDAPVFDYGLFYRASILQAFTAVANYVGSLPGADHDEIQNVVTFFHIRFAGMLTPRYAENISRLAAFNFLPAPLGDDADAISVAADARARDRERIRRQRATPSRMAARRAAAMRHRSVVLEELDPLSAIDAERLRLEIDRVSGIIVELESRQEEAAERVAEIVHAGRAPTDAERIEADELGRRVRGTPAAIITQQRRLERLQEFYNNVYGPGTK